MSDRLAAVDNVAAPKTRTPGRTPTTPPARKGHSESWEWMKSLGIALVFFIIIRTFLFQAFSIPSGSMESTLLVGDYLMANNTVFGARIPFTETALPGLRDPRHGEIVVFRPTYNRPVIDVVKRVIGEPGDVVEMREGVVYRNGERLEEPYARKSGTPDVPMQYSGPSGFAWHLEHLPAEVDRESYRPSRDEWGPLRVPEGHYFLMGDNRDESLDSRYVGFVPRDVIHGKPMFIYYSVDPGVDRPFRFLSGARWSRIGDGIR